MVERWNRRVTGADKVYVLGDAFWKTEDGLRLMPLLKGEKHLILGNHDPQSGPLFDCWKTVSHYADLRDGSRRVILSHYPSPFYNGHYHGTVMLYGHVHNSREWEILEQWKRQLWQQHIPGNFINVGCMLDYMDYTPRTLEELLAANPEPEHIGRKP